MAVGTSAGILSTRLRARAERAEETPALPPGALLARAVQRSRRVDPALEAKKVEVAAGKRAHLAKWNRYLRKFEYKKALNAVLEVRIPAGTHAQGRNVRDIVAVLEELRTRGDLKTAIRGRWNRGNGVTGRTDKELEPLISFVSYYIVDPKYTDILTTVAEEILSGPRGELTSRSSWRGHREELADRLAAGEARADFGSGDSGAEGRVFRNGHAGGDYDEHSEVKRTFIALFV